MVYRNFVKVLTRIIYLKYLWNEQSRPKVEDLKHAEEFAQNLNENETRIIALRDRNK
jgi:hypothetical protein